MNESLIMYEVSDRIATISLNRKEKRNALNPELTARLTNCFREASNDPNVKVIILKAEGTTFSAGADLEYLQQLRQNSYEENLADSRHLKDLFTSIYFCPKVVIAQVEGHAIAGGCGLATVCDVVFAVPEAKFGYTEVLLGFVPAIVSCFLLRKISESIARQILLSGELFTAEQALQYGLINFVTTKDIISQKTREFALNLCTQTSTNSLLVTKKLISQIVNPDLEKNLELAVQINASVRESDDFKNGVQSFLSKEKINW